MLQQPLRHQTLPQIRRGTRPARPRRQPRAKVLEAARAGAKLVVLPECFNSPYGTKHFPKYAEELVPLDLGGSPSKGGAPTEAQSPSYHVLSAVAKEGGITLVGGSIPEYSKEKQKWYNTSLTFGEQGQLLARHRKVHLFDIDIPGKISFHESEVLSPGDKVTLVEVPGYGKIGLAICYDIRFPELALIAARKGAFALVYPGAFNLTTGARHWELLARARAVDNQCYVALCSPARDMQADYHAWGHSMVVDPDAAVVGELDEKEGTLYVDLVPEKLEETRRNIPVYGQRRFDVYPDVSEGKVRFEDYGGGIAW